MTIVAGRVGPSLIGAAAGYGALVARAMAELPRRARLRRKYAQQFGLEGTPAPVAPREVAALLRVKNEDFWIELILRVVTKVFSEVVVIDTGSQDRTLTILDALQREGLPFALYRHAEPPEHMTVIANLLVDHRVRAEWVYLVDGDEVQLEGSCRALLEHCQHRAANPRMRRIACHQLILHPADILRATPPHCRSVRYMHGRAYRRARVRLSEHGLSDALVARLGWPGTNDLIRDSAFLPDALLLHCPLNQRSTNPAHRGFVDLLPTDVGDRYRARYRAADAQYVPLPFFPKEIRECRYSAHNHYLGALGASGVALV